MSCKDDGMCKTAAVCFLNGCQEAASTAASEQQASVSELPGLEYRTCCDHPDCTTCRGHGGFYRIAALTHRATTATPSEPTEAMLNAARDWSVKKYGIGIGNDAAIGCWQAMLAAAPGIVTTVPK